MASDKQSKKQTSELVFTNHCARVKIKGPLEEKNLRAFIEQAKRKVGNPNAKVRLVSITVPGVTTITVPEDSSSGRKVAKGLPAQTGSRRQRSCSPPGPGKRRGGLLRQVAREYLKENRPEEYRQMKEAGELERYCVQKERQALDAKRRLMDQGLLSFEAEEIARAQMFD